MLEKGQSSRPSDRNGVESLDRSNGARSDKRDSHAPGCLQFRAAVTAAGMDLKGHSFVANTHTEFIAPSGCSLILKQALAGDDDVDLHIGGRQVHGRVAAKLKSLKEGYLYAIEFDPAADFRWNVPFPEMVEAAPALQLYCTACDLPGDVALNGLDALVYEAAGAITRTCPLCRERTRWAITRGASQPRTRVSLPPPTPGAGPRQTLPVLPLATQFEPLQPRPRTREERKSARVQLKGAKACVETPVRGTEVVLVVNMSKSGLRFLSSKRYERGDWMKVAVPYTPGGNNIFVPAEIVRIHKNAANGIPGEYALRFRPA